ncbi:hypothetical protein DFS34DRAFT_648761 [Phlyctochytrium arcticum]|nr:hypothetical protein DFS34DRAFT_693496 [Phlyctochytrium arcticum]KAI9099814.1 hypothetical protein DFS34DRAFT_648761 [Phlyctochytrium arcticum]
MEERVGGDMPGLDSRPVFSPQSATRADCLLYSGVMTHVTMKTCQSIKRTTKRKFDSTTQDGKEEKEAALNLDKKVLKGGDAGVVNVTKAVKRVHQQGGLRNVKVDDRKQRRS